MDGTIIAAPALFGQIYTIHAVKYLNVIPTIDALLPNKSKATYSKSMPSIHNDKLLRTSCIGGSTDSFQTHKSVFFFHMTQCIYRKNSNTLKPAGSHPDLVLNTRMLVWLIAN